MWCQEPEQSGAPSAIGGYDVVSVHAAPPIQYSITGAQLAIAISACAGIRKRSTVGVCVDSKHLKLASNGFMAPPEHIKNSNSLLMGLWTHLSI